MVIDVEVLYSNHLHMYVNTVNTVFYKFNKDVNILLLKNIKWEKLVNHTHRSAILQSILMKAMLIAWRNRFEIFYFCAFCNLNQRDVERSVGVWWMPPRLRGNHISCLKKDEPSSLRVSLKPLLAVQYFVTRTVYFLHRRHSMVIDTVRLQYLYCLKL